jgi:C4-dicarboxylate-specific signal transduction histidine kinase
VEEFDPNEVVVEAVEIMALEAQAKVVGLKSGEPLAGLTLRAEKRRILDAVVNLVSNAVDAAAEVTGGRVEVRLEERGGELIFVVEDNGPGLGAEAQVNLGKGFFSTKGGAGTGLGLMVAHKTAKEHGGRVDYKPREPRGAIFRLVLPR